MNEATVKQDGAMITTQGFAEQSLETTGATMSSVLAAREKAMVEARLIVAMQRPRNWDLIRTKLLKAVERPGFADSDIEREGKPKQSGSAWYKLPFGDGAEGFSIRFAEECLRVMGNLDCQSQIIWEDSEKRFIGITVFDLESNISIPSQIVVEKTVEKKQLKKKYGKTVEVALRTRINSNGDVIYIVMADEGTMLRKQNAAISKSLRNGILRLVPGDIQAECRRRIQEIRHGKSATDPDGARKRMIDGFSSLNVSPKDLVEYTEFPLDKLTPAQIDHLRGLYKAIKDGSTSWQAVMVEVREERGESPEKTEAPKKGLEAVVEKNKAKGESQLLVKRNEAIEVFREIFGDDAIMELSTLLRTEKQKSIESATMEDLEWAITEIEDREAAKKQELLDSQN